MKRGIKSCSEQVTGGFYLNDTCHRIYNRAHALVENVEKMVKAREKISACSLVQIFFIFLEYLLESDEVANDSAKLRRCCLETASSSLKLIFSLKPA